MSWIRILIISTIAWLLYRLIRFLITRPRHVTASKQTQMVRCSFCNLYVVEDTAVHRGDHYYCSEEHYRKMTGENPG